MRISVITILLMGIVFGVFSQTSESDTASLNTYYESDQEAKEAVSKILKYTGLEPNFVIVEADVKTVIAYVKGGKRYIAYNAKFMKRVRNVAETDWAAVSILAHEIGHHLSGHTIKPRGINPGDELAADKFSGFILYKMGATLDEAKAALINIGNEIDTIEHPVIDIRIQAVSNGWLEAKYLDDKDAFEGDTLIRQPYSALIFKCRFKNDPNVYFIDADNQIIWFDNYGVPVIIGSRSESDSPNYIWYYNYRGLKYGIDVDNNIWDLNFKENVYIIGVVEIL